MNATKNNSNLQYEYNFVGVCKNIFVKHWLKIINSHTNWPKGDLSIYIRIIVKIAKTPTVLMVFQGLLIPKFQKNPNKSKVARDLPLAGELQIWQISCVWMMYFVFACPSDEEGWTGCTCLPLFCEKQSWKSLEVFSRHDLYTTAPPDFSTLRQTCFGPLQLQFWSYYHKS